MCARTHVHACVHGFVMCVWVNIGVFVCGVCVCVGEWCSFLSLTLSILSVQPPSFHAYWTINNGIYTICR